MGIRVIVAIAIFLFCIVGSVFVGRSITKLNREEWDRMNEAREPEGKRK
jgi:hypothetical protein